MYVWKYVCMHVHRPNYGWMDVGTDGWMYFQRHQYLKASDVPVLQNIDQR